MKPTNLLYIMADEHNPQMLGCYGHGQVQTPNLDRLAEKGVRFTSAYTNSPICIPARAAFATGRYAHETRHWDNAMPYDGEIKGWGHRLQEEGIRVESIGKLHYRGKEENTGFAKQHHPMHVMGGIGQVWGSVRDPMPEARPAKMLNEIGPGESHYNRYDRLIADTGKQWLKDRASSPDDKPWVLYLGFVAPHFPLVVPQPYYDLYPLEGLPGRKLDPEAGYQRHPWLQRQDDFSQIDRYLSPQQRRMAVAAYFGLCTYVDALIGEVVDTLNDLGLADTTRIAYTSDHGDNVGARGMWGKSNLYQESAGIPLILSGPDVPAGHVCETPVSLLDTYQTVLQAVGLKPTDEEWTLSGRSWFETAGADYDQDRIVLSEYHAAQSPTGAFMIRRGDFKLNYYVDYYPEFFDLKKDPEETQNVADDPVYEAHVREYMAALRGICDPEATDRCAKDDQNDLIEQFGGREGALSMGTPGATPVPGQGQE